MNGAVDIVVEQTAKPRLAADAPPAAEKPKPTPKAPAEKQPFDPRAMGAESTSTLPPPADAKPVAKWDPDSAAEFIVAPHNAVGLATFVNNGEAFDAWEASPKEVGSGPSKAIARLLDRTPLGPEEGGLAGLIPQLLISFGAIVRIELGHWRKTEEVLRRQKSGQVLPGMHPPAPQAPVTGAGPAPGPPAPAPPPAPAAATAIDVNAEGPIYTGDAAAFLAQMGAIAEHGRRNGTV